MIDGADEVEAGGIGITGLDAVHALITIHQIVVATDAFSPETEGFHGEEAVFLGKVALQRKAELGHVARSRHLRFAGQAGGVAEHRLGHAELAGLAGHHVGEPRFGAAEVIAHTFGHVIGGFDDHTINGLAHGEGLALSHIELRGDNGCTILGHRYLLVPAKPPGVQRLEGHVKRHHLGE
ncbi:hypothetical protein D3C78_1095770 [compost metagenome]